MVNLRGPARFAASDTVLICLSAFLGTFAALGVLGVFEAQGSSLMRVLHRPQAVAAALALLCALAARIAMVASARSDREDPKSRAVRLLFLTGFFLCTAGVVVSSFVRFEGGIALTEGQRFGDGGTAYEEGSVSQRRYARAPDLDLAMLEIVPRIRDAGMALRGVSARVLHIDRPSGAQDVLTLRSWFPVYRYGAWLHIKDFGYSPFYRISGPSGEVLDEAFVSMRLFPPGAEDSFRLRVQPETFYLKYYPAGTHADALSAAPQYRLRIARNLDLIVPSRAVSPGEKVGMGGGMAVSFEQIRHWGYVTIVKDAGFTFVMLPGAVLMLTALTLAARKGINVLTVGRRQEN